MVSEGGGGIGISDSRREWRGGEIDLGGGGGGGGCGCGHGVSLVCGRGGGLVCFILFHSTRGGITDHGSRITDWRVYCSLYST